MKKILYELSNDKKSLLVTNLWINEHKLKEYKLEKMNGKPDYWKLYKLETNIDLSKYPKGEEKILVSFKPYNENLDDNLFLPKNYIRIIETSKDTLFEKIRQDKIIKSYINNCSGDNSNSVLLPSDEDIYEEVYKLPSPGQMISPFIYGEEIYLFSDILKVPIELQALDFFLASNYKDLTLDVYSKYIPWQLFEKEEQRTVPIEWFNTHERSKKEDLEEVTKVLKLYKEYKVKKGD